MNSIKWYCVVLLLLSQTMQAQVRFPSTPDSAVIHTEDIELFWKAFDACRPEFEGDKLKTLYLDAGSAGLKGFIPMRIMNGKNLGKTIRGDIAYYDNIRASSMEIMQQKTVLQDYLRTMEKLYSDAVFPDIYFVIGARNSGGTTFKGGLIIGAEMFGPQTDSFKARLPFSSVNLTVIHELVHFQQQYSNNMTLLNQCLREGAADFICELITGSHSNQYFYGYGDEHAAELWTAFQTQMNGTQWGEWLYGGSKTPGKPNDLGYWMGYKICKAYYQKATDKQKAVADILNIKDPKAFLEASGYGH